MKENGANGQILVGGMGCVLIPKVQPLDSLGLMCDRPDLSGP